MSVISFSLSTEDIARINAIAEERHFSRSQVVKEAITLYEIDAHLRRMRATGDQIAKRLGIETDDDVQALLG
jgi:predicted transcriptional regulator